MLADHKGEIPFVVLLLPFIIGIAVALNFPIAANYVVLVTATVALAFVFLLLNFAYADLLVYRYQWLGGILLHCILFCAGWLCTIHAVDINDKLHFSKNTAQQLVVRISDEPIIKNGAVRFTAVAQQNINNKKLFASTGKLFVNIKDSAAFTLNYGDELLIPSTYTPVDPPFNPAEFNYKQYLANQNIYHRVYLYPRQYVALTQNNGNAVLAYALSLRKRMVAKFKAGMHDTAAIAIASTLILGYKANLDQDIQQTYAATGTLHVLSVSGAHVALVYLLLGWLLFFLDGSRNCKLMKAAIIILLIWAYALLTGFSPAICRAAIMISLVITGKSFYRHINVLNLLAASAFALLLYNPLNLVDVGFQLSYLAVGGLIVFQPLLYQTLKFKNNIADNIWSPLTVSIAAQLITFPLSAFYFHQFPVYFLISNLLIIIPVMVIMYAGILYLLLAGVPYISTCLAYILENSILIMNKGLHIIDNLPFASISKIWLSNLEHLLLYGIIICFFYFLFKPAKLIIWAGLTCLLIFFLSTGSRQIQSINQNSITFLNLRKQNGIVFKHGNEAVVLTDLPSDDKTFNYAVKPGIDSSLVKTTHIYSLAQNVIFPYFKKHGNLIQFNHQLILLADSNINFKDFNKPLNIDYLYISGNAKYVLAENKNLFARLKVISADNSNAFSDTLVKQLSADHEKIYLLKRNKSLNLVSN